ncbi:MAG: extracellular solute-binding protein, partial [Candidatus Competibacter sp.]|nr:extracellular solute-binding protein [Candidatus Competibacter sp.]
MFAALVLAACDDRPAAPTRSPAKELAYCDWVDYQVRPVMEAFEKEYGTKIKYVPLPTQEAFAEALRGGKCDVAVIGNELVPALAAGGLLAEVDYRNVLNFRNVAANFRDLVYDPNNRFSIPFRWGTIGLLVRTDQATRPAGRWADLGAAGKT